MHVDMKVLRYASTFQKRAREFSQKIRIVMSDKPMDTDFQVQQTNDHHKPRGLWYAFGGAWIEWMSGEMPEWLGRYDYIYVIEVDDSKLVKVSIDNVKEFSEKYNSGNQIDRNQVDWNQVAGDFCGFEAPPPYRKGWGVPLWWNTIDIPSGCIWDSSCITSFRRIGEKKGEEWHLKGEEEEKVTTSLPDTIDDDDYYKNIMGWDDEAAE